MVKKIKKLTEFSEKVLTSRVKCGIIQVEKRSAASGKLRKEYMAIQCKFLEKKIHILTENVDGELYMLEADDINEIVNDWMGDCNHVPANDAKVFFASYCGEPINPYLYTDFLSLAQYIRNNCFGEQDRGQA